MMAEVAGAVRVYSRMRICSLSARKHAKLTSQSTPSLPDAKSIATFAHRPSEINLTYDKVRACNLPEESGAKTNRFERALAVCAPHV